MFKMFKQVHDPNMAAPQWLGLEVGFIPTTQVKEINLTSSACSINTNMILDIKSIFIIN